MVNHMTNNRICQAVAEDIALESSLVSVCATAEKRLAIRVLNSQGARDQMESGTTPEAIPRERGRKQHKVLISPRILIASERH